MIENGLILTGSDAELLSRALTEVRTKALEDSEVSLDNSQALETLVSYCKKEEHKEETGPGEPLNPLRKRIVLGTIIHKRGDAEPSKQTSSG